MLIYFFRYAEYGTILDIRDRVLLKDGCSILSTVGGRRYRVLSGGEKDGYDTAQVEFLRDTVVQEDQLLNLLELHDKVNILQIQINKIINKTNFNQLFLQKLYFFYLN